MNLKKLLSAIIVFSLTFSSIITYAGLYDSYDMVLQSFDSGEINWTEMTIRASGTGVKDSAIPDIAVAKLGAEREAKIAAIRKLFETTRNIRVDSSSTAGEQMTTSDYVRSRVETATRRAKIVDKKFRSDEVEVTVEIPITGLLTEALLTQTEKIELPSMGEEIYTGVIIDATGLGLKPVISPRVLDEAHSEIYGASFVSKESAVRNGMVAYEKSVSQAKKSDRVSSNPLVIRAIRIAENGSSVIISRADAMALRDRSENLSFLTHCRVIIVVD